MSNMKVATSCLPGGADAPLSQGRIIKGEQIEERSRTVRNLQDILTSEVPGLTSFGESLPELAMFRAGLAEFSLEDSWKAPCNLQHHILVDSRSRRVIVDVSRRLPLHHWIRGSISAHCLQ